MQREFRNGLRAAALRGRGLVVIHHPGRTRGLLWDRIRVGVSPWPRAQTWALELVQCQQAFTESGAVRVTGRTGPLLALLRLRVAIPTPFLALFPEEVS